MPFEIIRNDITKVSADAIVNTANPHVAIGPGVDSAVYNAAGKEKLLAARKKIGEMQPGDVAVTEAFDLDAKYIIHTVGPVWQGGGHGETGTLATCYSASMKKARELGCREVAFPLLAAGAYGFPKDVALKIAVREISSFLLENEMTVYIVVYDKEAFAVSGKLFDDIRSYIEDEDVVQRSLYERHLLSVDAAPNIDEALGRKEETFQQHLFRLIDRRGLEDKEVYKKANIDRKHFSKIRSNVDYNPSKRTALALAIALELNLDETTDLLMRAGIALSPSSTFDIIMEYCIEHNITDIYEINCILFEYDQPILGG